MKEKLEQMIEQARQLGYDPVAECRQMISLAPQSEVIEKIVEEPDAALVMLAMLHFIRSDVGIGVDVNSCEPLGDGIVKFTVNMPGLFDQYTQHYLASIIDQATGTKNNVN